MPATAPRPGALLATQRFSGFGKRNRAVAERALARLPERSVRVLDLGCAAGDTLLFLALARPEADLAGIDISADSVEVARRRLAEDGLDRRVAISAGDYLDTTFDAPFDVIVADQVLHLAAAPSDDALAAKLAGDLRPGGALVAEMPYAGPYNTALIGLRRVLRRARGPRLDRLALALARRLRSGTLDDEQLQERLVYNYVIPERLASRRWDGTLAAAGLHLDERTAMRQESPAQPRHHLSVYLKAGG